MFYVLLTGKGEGCDYSIACNQKWEILQAKTWEEANAEVSKRLGDFKAIGIASATILEVNKVERVNMLAWEANKLQMEKEVKEEKEKAERKAQYEKLKKEFKE